MMKKQYFIYAFVLSMMFLTACRLQDAQVAPVGKPIEYVGPTLKMKQLLDSSNLSIYKAIWKKVNMDSVIGNKGLQAYTVLAPSDEAFTTAGITAAKVNTMTVADLDTLLFYHVLDTWISGDQLNRLHGNNNMRSLLTRIDFPGFYDNSPYIYYQYLGVHAGKLIINGAPHPFKTLEATNGTIYVLDEMLKKPERDMYDYLTGNPDFEYLMEALRISDSIYQNSWSSPTSIKLLKNTAENRGITFFAPTNRAFQAAGFKTIDDLRRRALLYPVDYAHYDDNYYYVTPTTSLDSLLSVNHLDFNGVVRADYPVMLFSNDFTDNLSLAGFTIKPGAQFHDAPQFIRLSFTSSNGSVMVKQIGSSQPAYKLVTTDLLFNNGVIHVIEDGLFKP